MVEAIGLTSAEVAERRAAGLGNTVADPTSRPLSSIIRANVFTRFNAILSVLAVLVLVVGHPVDAVFGLVMVFNSAIGIAQEVRAKRTLDGFRVLLAATVAVVRDGEAVRVPPGDLVVGDLILVEAGDQIPVDAVVATSRGAEADESALTGESRPVRKAAGDELLSGSSLVAGSATATAHKVGDQAWARQLTAEARTFTLSRSELRDGIDQLLRVISWVLVPLGLLLLLSQLRASAGWREAAVQATAGVEALVPQGLVLLVSFSMAVAILRLARQRVVAQELFAVEGLARVDTLCLDKTGTLTTGELTLDGLTPLGSTPPDDLAAALVSMAGCAELRSPTLDLVATALGHPRPGGVGAGPVPEAVPSWEVSATVAFSSERKWSSATFAHHGTWVLGAPEILLDAMDPGPTSAAATDPADVAAQVDALAADGCRVLLVARGEGQSADDAGDADGDRPADDPVLPAGLGPVGLVVLREELRPDAADTLAFFARQGVEVKVISGDNPRTVAAVARRLGLTATAPAPAPDGTGYPADLAAGDLPAADLREVGPEELAGLAAGTTVFGRVRPDQKRDLVRALQAQGRVVAMTGDGVNDIPSLKAADIGIAMNTATPATKAVAQLVLLDGRFDRLPDVVAEGRRVIANMERVSSLFLTKTTYAAVLAVAVAATGIPFPFLPRHLSLISTLTIGIPAFVLSFRSSDRPYRPGFLRRVLTFAVPSGFGVGGATLAGYQLARWQGAPLDQARSAAALALTVAGFVVLYRLTRPLDRLEGRLLALLVAASAVITIPSPLSRLYGVVIPPLPLVALSLGSVAVVMSLMVVLDRVLGTRFARRPRRGPAGAASGTPGPADRPPPGQLPYAPPDAPGGPEAVGSGEPPAGRPGEAGPVATAVVGPSVPGERPDPPGGPGAGSSVAPRATSAGAIGAPLVTPDPGDSAEPVEPEGPAVALIEPLPVWAGRVTAPQPVLAAWTGSLRPGALVAAEPVPDPFALHPAPMTLDVPSRPVADATDVGAEAEAVPAVAVIEDGAGAVPAVVVIGEDPEAEPADGPDGATGPEPATTEAPEAVPGVPPGSDIPPVGSARDAARGGDRVRFFRPQP